MFNAATTHDVKQLETVLSIGEDQNRNAYDDGDHASDIDDAKEMVYTDKKKKKKPFAVQLLTLVFGIMKQGSSLLDSITDLLLLYTASKNSDHENTQLFMMILCIALLAPYILSYSSGIELFLYRKTFENVRSCSFLSLLLTLYILPTGILFFIVIDVFDAVLQIYKLLQFIIGRSSQDIMKFESMTVEYFGMSQMDWISFRKQKKIAQLFFETIPQVVLQTLLYTGKIPGKESLGVTNQALLLSLASASFNCTFTLITLIGESKGVQESFVEYSLHCITARFGWVPFQFMLSDYFAGNFDTMKRNHHPNGICRKIFAFTLNKNNVGNKLEINYKIKYRIPMISYLTGGVLTQSIEYQFSEDTLKSLMATIKAQHSKGNNYSLKQSSHRMYDLQIRYGNALSLLSVRQIIALMQACRLKGIQLPDIHHTDWPQAFKNSKDDPRLYSNTFDEHQQSLLISLYLTGYDNNNWEILKKFIYDFDVPINVQDADGNTVLHHILKKKDDTAMRVLLDSLKPNQRIHFGAQNDEGEVVIQEIIKHYGVDGLKDALNALKPRQTIDFNMQDNHGDTIFHHLIKNNDIDVLNDILFVIVTNRNKNYMNLSISNNSDESLMVLALHNDKQYLTKIGRKNRVLEEDTDDDTIILDPEEEKEYENVIKEDEEEEEEDQNSENEEEKEETELNADIVYDTIETDEDEDDINTDDEENDIKIDDEENKDIEIETMEESNKVKDEWDEWVTFEHFWLTASEHSMIPPQTMINILYLKANEFIMRISDDDIRCNEKQSKMKWIQNQIKKMYKQCEDRGGLKKMLKQEIKNNAHKMNSKDGLYPQLDDANDYKNKMMHRILLKYDSNINNEISHHPQQSTLGYVLKNYAKYNEYFDIVNHLLSNNVRLMMHEISIFVKLFVNAAWKSNANVYFHLFEKVLKHNNIVIDSVVDEAGNTPIHHLVINHKRNKSTAIYANKLKRLCTRYPQWLFIRNISDQIPLLYTIMKHDMDGLFALSRHMFSYNRTELSNILSDKSTVQSMINAGCKLLEEGKKYRIALLLQCFDYFEIFYYPSHKTAIYNYNTFENINENDFESLIRRASTSGYEIGHKIRTVLYSFCGLRESDHANEYVYKEQQASKHYPTNEIIIDYKDYFNDIVDDKQNRFIVDNDGGYKNKGIVLSDDQFVQEERHVNYIEIVYSTVVESFSVMDLYTDCIIFLELYKTDNPWWTTCMALLILSPYLVSYSALSTLLLKKIEHFRNSSFLSVFILLLMTPLSILYLLSIDVIFMLYSLSSTFIFAVSCCNPKCNIRDYLDEIVFNKLLRMNRTEIISYRRLRTLSQLCFETIPQIILQARILYVIKVEADNNQFQINISTLIWSLSLAFLHLLLEGGVISFDSKTLKTPFAQYCMICLGGRVQWIPYQHFVEYIVQNQLFMQSVFDVEDNEEKRLETQSKFDCLLYAITCLDEDELDDHSTVDDMDDKDTVTKNLMALDYEDICQDILCFRYEITYQFSNSLMQHLSEQLINSSPMMIPAGFKLSTTNISLQRFFNSILCKSELHLGYVSCGNINIYALCKLYQSSLNKFKLNINKIDTRTVEKIKRNTTLKQNDSFEQIITSLLIQYGELSAIAWIYDSDSFSYEDKMVLSSGIADAMLPSFDNPITDLVRLRNCFKNKYFISSNCLLMRKIKDIVIEYKIKCKYDGSWCYALMILLFYSRGTILYGDCIHGCCGNINNTNLNQLFMKYLPSMIHYGEMLIPFQLFECSKLFKYYQIEQILINKCKNWIILNDNLNDDQENDSVSIPMDNVVEYKYIGKAQYNNILNKLLAPVIDYEDVALLDELVYECKLYHDYNSYLTKTLKFRKLINCEASFRTDSNRIEIRMNQLIPDWSENNHRRHQIFQLIISSQKQKEDNIEQIYFKDINNKTSVLNDTVYLWNSLVADIDNEQKYDQDDDDNSNSNEIVLNENNVGLSLCNYNLLHHFDNLPVLVIETKIDCQISIYIKYAHLYREHEPVERKKHRDMSLWAYSQLLFDSIKLNNYAVGAGISDADLKNLCFNMTLWVTLPNKAIFEYDLKHYLEMLGRCDLITNVAIAQSIATFIIHPRNYLSWQQFATLELIPQQKRGALQNQLVWYCGDNMFDFRYASVDYLNVPTQILDRNKTCYVNIYLWGKGDESFFGLLPVADYSADCCLIQGATDTALGTTGGRKSSTRHAGGFKSSPCTGYPQDCNHGCITKGGEVKVHPMDAHSAGDWIQFMIDFKNNYFAVYKNGIFQGSVDGLIPEGPVFLVSEPDTEEDKYYIEQEVDMSMWIKEEDVLIEEE